MFRDLHGGERGNGLQGDGLLLGGEQLRHGSRCGRRESMQPEHDVRRECELCRWLLLQFILHRMPSL